MRDEYDFSQGKRGPVIARPPTQTEIRFYVDLDLLAWFRDQVHKAGGGNYQHLMNDALRDYMEAHRDDPEEGASDTP